MPHRLPVVATCLLLVLTLGATHSAAATHIPTDAFVEGCPELDCIPSIDRPTFDDGQWLDDADRVVGVALGAEARAYPVRILNWHEIVNDEVDGRNVTVTYCPRCGTGIVMDRDVAGRTLTFGVSGKLWMNNLLMYDRETGSLWVQVSGTAAEGPLHDTRLTTVPSVTTSWGAWKQDHPTTRVLSQPEPGEYHAGVGTASARDYGRYPYGSYESDRGTLYPRGDGDLHGLHPKTFVVGHVDPTSGAAVAAPYPDVARAGAVNGVLPDGRTLVFTIVSGGAVAYQSPAGPLTWRGTTLVAGDGSRFAPETGANLSGGPALVRVEAITGFAFAWFDFHPESALVRSDASDRAPDAGGAPGQAAPGAWWEVPGIPAGAVVAALVVASCAAGFRGGYRLRGPRRDGGRGGPPP